MGNVGPEGHGEDLFLVPVAGRASCSDPAACGSASTQWPQFLQPAASLLLLPPTSAGSLPSSHGPALSVLLEMSLQLLEEGCTPWKAGLSGRLSLFSAAARGLDTGAGKGGGGAP